jgi:hypothetical protein
MLILRCPLGYSSIAPLMLSLKCSDMEFGGPAAEQHPVEKDLKIIHSPHKISVSMLKDRV